MAWEHAPHAHIAHPRADHLMPLHVVAGAASNDPATCIFGNYIADIATSAWRFGGNTQASPFDARAPGQASAERTPHAAPTKP